MINDDLIITTFYKNNKLNISIYLKYKNLNVNDSICNYLKSRFKDSDSLKETLFRIKNKIEIRPNCKTCNSKVKFIGKSNKAFNDHCSCKCAQLDKDVQNLHKNTNENLYGVKTYNNIDKAKRTCLQKYSVENPFQYKDFQKSLLNTKRHELGWQTILSYKDHIIPLFSKEEYDKFNFNKTYKFKWKCIKCGYEFKNHIHKTMHIEEFPYLPRCIKCYPFMSGFSKLEKEICNFIKSIYNENIVENDRTVLTPNEENKWKKNHELDIYIPELKLAIEVNGTYFHNHDLNENSKITDDFKNIQCKSKGIELITVWEDDWKTNKNEIKEYLKQVIFLKNQI